MSGRGGTSRPLADRMRPRTLDEFVGQDHIVGPGRLLRRAIQADQLSSVIFHGPPGTGKTTLARIIANTTKAHFTALNAVLAGVADLRKAVAAAEARTGDLFGQRTLLFVDEVHRFNKAQQDALLPWVESGTVTLIGATTENPFFEVNKALVSRSRVFQLRTLDESDLRSIAMAALSDVARGYGKRDVEIDEDALYHLANVSNGDARAILNALELAVETTTPDEGGRITVTLAVAEESIQQRAVLYDKEGDAHYDAISAFIKSVRGSDPDAALYWLARMVYAGEDPRFIFRRMFILAAEDIGLADPEALGVVSACARAFDYVGLPEGQFHLSEAVLYLATAPKSNSTLAYFDALEAVKSERSGEVPTHLKDGNRDGAAFGHGAGYRYPHAYRDHWVAQQYLPAALLGCVFYKPTDQGQEGMRRPDVLRRREAQLEAMAEDSGLPAEGLSWAGALAEGASERESWLARAGGEAAARLAELRDVMIGAAGLRRHELVLDLRAGAGLLTWEAARMTPEGGVWAVAADEASAGALSAPQDDQLDAPAVLVCSIESLPQALAARDEGDVRFDAILGRDLLGSLPPDEWQSALSTCARLSAEGGRIILAESVPTGGSLPSHLANLATVSPELHGRVIAAETEVLAEDERLARTSGDFVSALNAAGFAEATAEAFESVGLLTVSSALITRLFDEGRYAGGMAERLSPEDLAALRKSAMARVGGPDVEWHSVTVVIVARKVPA